MAPPVCLFRHVESSDGIDVQVFELPLHLALSWQSNSMFLGRHPLLPCWHFSAFRTCKESPGVEPLFCQCSLLVLCVAVLSHSTSFDRLPCRCPLRCWRLIALAEFPEHPTLSSLCGITDNARRWFLSHQEWNSSLLAYLVGFWYGLSCLSAYFLIRGLFPQLLANAKQVSYSPEYVGSWTSLTCASIENVATVKLMSTWASVVFSFDISTPHGLL